MKQEELRYNIRVNYRNRDENERRYVVSKKLADIINLDVGSMATKR